MKKSLLLLALVIVGAGIFWAATRPAGVGWPEVRRRRPGQAPKAPAAGAAGLSADQDPTRRADPSAAIQPKPEAHASPDAGALHPTPAPLFAGHVSEEFLQTAESLSHAGLLEYRVKLRGGIAEREALLRASTSAKPSKRASAPYDTDVWDVVRANTSTGALCFCVQSGRDKEQGVDLYDVYVYPADADPQWAALQDELEWIEHRLPSVP
jgi:hypothetical protein